MLYNFLSVLETIGKEEWEGARRGEVEREEKEKREERKQAGRMEGETTKR